MEKRSGATWRKLPGGVFGVPVAVAVVLALVVVMLPRAVSHADITSDGWKFVPGNVDFLDAGYESPCEMDVGAQVTVPNDDASTRFDDVIDQMKGQDLHVGGLQSVDGVVDSSVGTLVYLTAKVDVDC